jgi:hypothetical protein|tara:strand:+ start:5081 stop:6043 length:963 start_codon:yes stop_codon:yes gene_type:complete
MLSYESLLKEIKQMMGEKNLISIAEQEVDTEEQTKTISLPKFKISEKWGVPGSEDRKTISLFLKKIKGNTIQEKINSLETFVKGCDEACVSSKDVPEILGNLVFLESLSSIVYDFNAKTSGFLWESLLAALIGGDAKQVAAKGGRNTPLEDLTTDDGNNALSLKLVKKDTQYIGGSIAGLRRAFEKFGQVTYIIVTKEGDPEMKMNFYELVLTPENYDTYTRSIKDLKEASGSTTWKIHQRMYEENKIATLSLGSPESLKTIAIKYTERLGEGVTSIFNSLDSLTTNINQYFVASPDSKGAGNAAQTEARILKQKVDQEF